MPDWTGESDDDETIGPHYNDGGEFGECEAGEEE